MSPVVSPLVESLHCPFCLGRDVVVKRNDSVPEEWESGVSAVCRSVGCGATGPFHKSDNDALTAWNTRSRRPWLSLYLCPFCGENGARIMIDTVSPVSVFSVQCALCHATGPERQTDELALEAWVGRAKE